MMESMHNLRFRWNDHVPHLSKIFSEQRIDEHYCDTTLVSEDGFIIKAHCMILTMTSGYFERVLCNVTSDQHPIIILDGVNYRELACIMDYIYQGITQVDQYLMESVLDLADMLEIKGLSKMKSNASIKKLIAPTLPQNLLQRSSPTSPSHKNSHPVKSSTPKIDCEDNLIIYEKRDSEDERNIDKIGSKVEKMESQKSEIIDVDQKQLNLSDSIDQTLGIDLSLSKVTVDKDAAKNSDTTLLRKRKNVLEKQEQYSDSNVDPEFGKLIDKNQTHMPYKKKKCFGKIEVTSMSDITSHQQDTSSISNDLTLEKLANLLSKEKNTKVTNLLAKKTADVDSEVEVSCSDDGLTISVTTGPELDSFLSPFKKDSVYTDKAQVSLSLRKSKKRMRTKKEMEEAKEKWLAKERRNLFSNCLISRPTTRSFLRQKSDKLNLLESVSINCDPPFPTEDPSQSANANWSSESKSKEVTLLEQKRKKNRVTLKSKKVGTNRRKNSISPLTLFTLPPTKAKEKQTRTSLTLEEKIKVIESFLDGKSQRQIARMYGIGKTQVNGIVKKREEILSLYRENLVNGEKLTMKRQRKSEYAILNEHLIKWYRHMTVVAGIKITTGMLRAKALQIAPQLGCHDFKGSNGWLATFKANNNLKFSKCKSKKMDSYSNQCYQEENGNNEDEETEYFEEEGEEEHINNLSIAHSNPESNAEGGAPNTSLSTSHHSTRGEAHLDVVGSSAPQAGISNISLGNSILASGSLPKPPQMSNVSLGSNLAYNLTRDHSRGEMARGEIGHLSDLHPSSVNAASTLSHPTLPKPDAALSYKSEDALAYGYDTQTRMNEGSSRGTAEYNYTHYGFPSTYYGYHFLGQY